jgi:hypothetical protein
MRACSLPTWSGRTTSLLAPPIHLRTRRTNRRAGGQGAI